METHDGKRMETAGMRPASNPTKRNETKRIERVCSPPLTKEWWWTCLLTLLLLVGSTMAALTPSSADAAAAAAPTAAAAAASGRRTIYLVRHSESRYNDALKSRSLKRLIGERDHGLSEAGYLQCARLSDAVAAAAAAGDADALAIVRRDVTYSSPLTRAILTAHLSLPRSGASTDNTRSSRDGRTAGHTVVALPDAREQCMVRVFARDSEGTAREHIQANVDAELLEAAAKSTESAAAAAAAARGTGSSSSSTTPVAATAVKAAQTAALPLPRDPMVVDTSQVAEEVWWTIGERRGDIDARLGRLLGSLYDKAPPWAPPAAAAPASGGTSGGGAAVVLVSHSRVIRMLMQNHYVDERREELDDDGDADKTKEATTAKHVTKDLVENCAVLRLHLEQQEDKDATTTTTTTAITDAAFLFGTGFK
jgi:broad specificity phosphatase PhoE